MEREKIVDELKQILAMADDRPVEEMDFPESANLITEVGLSSVGILYMVIAIEETFGISFDNVNFKDFTTLGDVIDFISERVQ